MSISSKRRALFFSVAIPFIPSLSFGAAAATLPSIGTLEESFQGRVGVAAIDLANGHIAGNRQDERFPFCSTFKAILAAVILKRSVDQPGLLGMHLRYTKADLRPHSPLTEKHFATGMTVAELCAATIQYSDNAAANLLIGTLGGPAAVTAYARAWGDPMFRLDRWETELNTAVPGDERDTTSPLAMARTLQKILTGNGLPRPQQQQLKEWMVGNTTGDTRIRAGVPEGWQVADKTGTGSYGVTNDVGVAYPPSRAPVVLAIYTHSTVKNAENRSDIVAAATKAALAALGI